MGFKWCFKIYMFSLFRMKKLWIQMKKKGLGTFVTLILHALYLEYQLYFRLDRFAIMKKLCKSNSGKLQKTIQEKLIGAGKS